MDEQHSLWQFLFAGVLTIVVFAALFSLAFLFVKAMTKGQDAAVRFLSRILRRRNSR